MMMMLDANYTPVLAHTSFPFSRFFRRGASESAGRREGAIRLGKTELLPWRFDLIRRI